MADVPVPSLAQAREKKIDELSNFFANDDLSLEDLERRIERVYKAVNVAELDAITSDLRSAVAKPDEHARAQVGRVSAAASPPTTYVAAKSRILSLMSSTRRVGRWVVPQTLDVFAVMSETKIDLTQASLPSGVIDIELRCVMAAFKLVVPPNVRVINEAHAIMANISSRAHELLPGDPPATAAMPVIRLTGYALMAEVKVVVRHVEDAGFDDDDDDD